MNKVIEITELCKNFYLYKNPRVRLLHFLGLVKENSNLIKEFSALKNINITIKKGEKVGIIGKNGSGKVLCLKFYQVFYQKLLVMLKLQVRCNQYWKLVQVFIQNLREDKMFKVI